MENCASNSEARQVRAEDVISKLKDDGDFDRLRLKIIRRLKENEDLRNNIISLVKQSAAINRPGVENMKPRQLSDAIHAEIGDKMLAQVSEGLWNVIKSPDGMKTEITETVRSIYEKLSNPRANSNGEPSQVGRHLSAEGGNNPSQGRKLEGNKKAKIENLQEDDDLEHDAPPGFTSIINPRKKLRRMGDCEDPDVPPGFG